MFHVRSCIGRSDDLLSGKSYYIVEVESLISLVQASQATRHIWSFSTSSFGERTPSNGSPPVRRCCGNWSPAAADPALWSSRRRHDGELVDLLPDLFAAFTLATRWSTT
jgi:hypothetical protein